MKRSYILSAIFILTWVCASAQRYFTPKLDVGVKAGVALSNQQFSPSVEQKMLPGIIGGVAVRYSEEKLFGLLAELNIDQRGWQEDFGDARTPEGGSFSYKRQLTYIDIPVMTHINFGNKVVRGFVNLGASAGFMIGDKATANFNYEDVSKVAGFPVANRHVNQMTLPVKNKFDYGIVAGGGMEFVVKQKHSLLLEARYYFGLGNIFSSSKKDEFSASRGTAIQLSLGYMFSLKK